jgi:SAM-dependent methyltransferase
MSEVMFSKLKSLLNRLQIDTQSYDPKNYWTFQGRNYKQKYHERFQKRLQETGYDRNIRLLLSTLHEFDFESILDVGCGYGLYLQAIEREFPDLVGIQGCDISPTQLEQAHEFLGSASRVKLDETNGLLLPYLDSSFDIVITYGVCIHVPDERIIDFITENLRVAKQAYVFIESSSPVPNYGYFSHEYPTLFRQLGNVLEIKRELDPKSTERLYVADLR